MNYIEQINNFWSYTEDLDISSSDTSVYFALLKYNNSLSWIKSFRCDYGIICQYSRVSKNTFYKSIENLSNARLITYEKGVRNVLKPKISILKLKNRKGIIKEQSWNRKGLEKEQNGNLYKLLNYKTIKLINTKEKVFCDFVNNNIELIMGNPKKIILIDAEKVLTAYQFLEKHAQIRISDFEMRNKKTFQDYEVFKTNFNTKVLTEEIAFDTNKLFARIESLNANWNKEKKVQVKSKLSASEILRQKNGISSN